MFPCGSNCPFCLFYFSRYTRNGIVNVCLVCFPLLLFACVLARITLGWVLLHGIFTTRELCYSIAKYIFVFFHSTVFHTVLEHFLSTHHRVCNNSLGLQTLICCDVEGVLDSKTKYADRNTHRLVEVALTNNAAIALSIVHRTVWSIKMNQSMETLLNVHASAKRKGAA